METNKTKTDLYTTVTNIIIEQLEKGVIPWEQTFIGLNKGASRLPRNFTTGKKYRGVNILLLSCASLQHNYATNEWATSKQWRKNRETVRSEELENRNLIVFWDTYEKETDGEIQKIPFLKRSWVYNRSQLKGYVPQELVIDQKSEVSLLNTIEEFVANTKAVIEHHKGDAYYMPLEDKIMMPTPEQFVTSENFTATENYYSVLLHELTHWTGSTKRLQRLNDKSFSGKTYAMEELVAELGAAFLTADFDLKTLEKGKHAKYIDHYLKLLKENNRSIFTAASAANKAVDYLHSFTPN